MANFRAHLGFHCGINSSLKVFTSKDVLDIRLVKKSSLEKKGSEEVSSGLAIGYDLHTAVNFLKDT